MTIKTKVFDHANYIETAEDVRLALDAAFEDGDPGVIQETIGAIARSKGMTEIARETGLGRESLYKALSANGNPSLKTVMDVLGALGFRLSVSKAL